MTKFQESKGKPPKARARKTPRRPSGAADVRRMEKNLALLGQIRSFDNRHQCHTLMRRGERIDFETALKDMRLEDAALLLREAVDMAGSSQDFEAFLEGHEPVETALFHEGAAVWRFPTARTEGARASLHIVGNLDTERPTVEKPHAMLTSVRDQRLVAQSGSFITHPGQSIRLPACHAHDLVLIVVSGEVRIGREGTGESHTVSAAPKTLAVCHLSTGATFNAPLIVNSNDEGTATGIWAIAGNPEANHTRDVRHGGPLPPLSVRTSALAWGAGAAEQVALLPPANNERYAHKSAVREGLFDRHDLTWVDQSKELLERACETAVRLISTPRGPSQRRERSKDIDLTIHDGIELMLPLSGGFWLWSSTEGQDAPRDGDQTASVTLSVFSKDREKAQAYELEMVTAGSSSQRFATDVVLLDSSVNHTVAALDTVPSTCLHVSFMPPSATNQRRQPVYVGNDVRTDSKVTRLSDAKCAKK